MYVSSAAKCPIRHHRHRVEELAALDAPAREALRRDATETLMRAGAHAVVVSIADLPSLVERIEARRAQGERLGAWDAW